jgi:uncharacterized membrane protein YqjE
VYKRSAIEEQTAPALNRRFLQLHSLCLHGLHVALGVVVLIGFYIQTDLRMMNCRAAACVLLVLIALVMAVDWTSSQIRKYLI